MEDYEREKKEEEEKYNNMTDEDKRSYRQKQHEEQIQKLNDSYDGKIHIHNNSDVDVNITTYEGGYFGNEPLTLVDGVEPITIDAGKAGYVQLNDVPNWNQDYVMNDILNPKVLKIVFSDTSEEKKFGLGPGLNVSAHYILGRVLINNDRRIVANFD